MSASKGLSPVTAKFYVADIYLSSWSILWIEITTRLSFHAHKPWIFLSTLSIKYPSIVKDIRQNYRLPCQSNIPLLLRIYGRKKICKCPNILVWSTEYATSLQVCISTTSSYISPFPNYELRITIKPSILWKYGGVATSRYDLRQPLAISHINHTLVYVPPFLLKKKKKKDRRHIEMSNIPSKDGM